MSRRLARGLLAVFLLVGGNAHAQPGSGAVGTGGRSQGRVYDPATVERTAGEVVGVERPTAAGGRGGGVHLELRTSGGETLSVHLGPASYVDQQGVKIATGDRIEVKGSRVTVDGKAVLVAAEVTKGEQKLLLRNDAGVPRWSGGRRQGAPP